jgi:hypothetical protein
MGIYNRLDSAYYLQANEPFSGLSDNKNGCVVLAFETEKYASKFIEENIEAITSRVGQIPEIKLISSSYDFMQLCAKYGYAGIELLSEEEQNSFVFCVRIEEFSSILPTAISYNVDGNSIIKTRFKEYEEKTYRTVKEWQRYDILDKVSARFSIKKPFRGPWPIKIFEIRTSNDEFLSLFKVPCLHHYNPLDGSMPFFTSINSAIDFLKNKDFMSHLMSLGGLKSNFNDLALDISEFSEAFKIIVIPDFKKRIGEIKNPFMGFVINPDGQRDSMGYGFFPSRKIDSEPRLYSVSGAWKINNANEFEKLSDRDSWEGSDSFFWNQINGFRLSHLDRSFSGESVTSRFSEFSVYDIEDLVQISFQDKENDESGMLETLCPESEDKKLKNYCIIWWDAVTGEGKEDPIFFDTIFELIIWLWDYECCRDYPIRRDGAHQSNGHIGVPESSNKDYEKNIHTKIQEQLIRIFKRIALEGYRPKDGDDLSGLVNSFFRTIHIDLLGFSKDLFFQLDGKEKEDLANLLNISDDFLESEFKDSYDQFDEYGAAIGRKSLGDLTWNKLSSKARFFICSSLSQLELLGISPQLDYSLVSIGFVKALEIELGLIFKTFATFSDMTDLSYDSKDMGESALVQISIKKEGKLPSLGTMAHLINPSLRDKNQLRKKLGDYIDNLECGEYLKNKKFWKDGVYKITTKYRNGGAHDSSISMNTAFECMNYILGDKENDGVLNRLLQ